MLSYVQLPFSQSLPWKHVSPALRKAPQRFITQAVPFGHCESSVQLVPAAQFGSAHSSLVASHKRPGAQRVASVPSTGLLGSLKAQVSP